MGKFRARHSYLRKGALVFALAGAMAAGGVSMAYASTTYWTAPSSAATVSSNLLTTYGVRAGSAGPDFLGVTNTNFDFTSGSASSNDQYTGYTTADLAGLKGAGLAIWSTSVNENVNPYYANLYYNKITGSSATQATTWMSNPETSSWGDSNNSASHVGNVSSGASTIAGLEYSPSIIFGANKYTNWQNAAANGSNSGTNIYAAESTNNSYNPTYTSNDATNVWTQVYTMGQLASTADSLKTGTSKITRYDSNSATESAKSYEKAIRGNMLYVASQIDAGTTAKKTVAYLYAIDANGTGYFFVPTASGLLNGNDTGASTGNSVTNPDSNYAANNSTINMGYMGTLPFITNTFDSGTAFSGGIIMKVEDIYKANPACTVSSSATSALSSVNTIIYNSTVNTNLAGTSGGKNDSGVNNDYQGTALSPSKVATWAAAHGFNTTTGSIIAGDDYGTSSQQTFEDSAATTGGTAPLLYCQRNYTADKNARAAWAFSQVYPALYGNNPDATYSYWVDKVYHVNTTSVGTVVKYMTNQSDTVTYNSTIASQLESRIQAGVNWWNNTGKNKSAWNQYAYYNGSTRASYYSGNADSEEATNTIRIFSPVLL